jgi:hypothetical protein
VRDSASQRRVEGRFLDAEGAETVLTRVIPRRSEPRLIDGRLATAEVSWRRVVPTWSTCTKPAPINRCSIRRSNAALDRFAGPGAARCA